MKQVFDEVRVVHTNYDDSTRLEFVCKSKSFFNVLRFGNKCERTWYSDDKQVFVPANLNDFVTALAKTKIENKKIKANHFYQGCLLSMNMETHKIPYHRDDFIEAAELINIACEKFDKAFESEDHKFGFKIQCKNILGAIGANVSFDLEKNKDCENREPFVADISLYEFENVDWFEFGRLLKQNKILPNSYIKKPSRVIIKQGKNDKPMVLVRFDSETSDSTREFVLLQDRAYQYVNGATNNIENKKLNDVWDLFRRNIRCDSEMNIKKESYNNIVMAESLMEDAKKMLERKNFYELEQEFLEKYKHATFDDFCYMPYKGDILDEVPAFVPMGSVEHKECNRLEPAIPFSPRTLEFCILHMTKGEKTEHGEYVEDFEEMCRKLQEFSCYESENWDRVIKIGKGIVENCYKESNKER